MTGGDSRRNQQISSRKAQSFQLYTAHSWNVQTLPYARSEWLVLTGCVVVGSFDVFVRACIFSRHLVHARRYRTFPAGFSPVHSLGLQLSFRIAVPNCAERCRVANSDTNCVQLHARTHTHTHTHAHFVPPHEKHHSSC